MGLIWIEFMANAAAQAAREGKQLVLEPASVKTAFASGIILHGPQPRPRVRTGLTKPLLRPALKIAELPGVKAWLGLLLEPQPSVIKGFTARQPRSQ